MRTETLSRGARRVRCTTLALAAAVVLGAVGAADAAVRINEIFYHPPSAGGRVLEFVELHNTAMEDVSIRGWRFTTGIEFEFPEGAMVPAQGYALVCRNKEVFTDLFRVSGPEVYGNFIGSLDNGGEEIVLVDSRNAVVDAVFYDDEAPWPREADGVGASLQRICPDGPSHLPSNWSGGPGEPPTPLFSNLRKVCPPPEPEVGDVVISEIHYHPARDLDAEEEYVELLNRGASEVIIAGWRLTGGVEFTFGPALRLVPGGRVVVCRNVDVVRARFGIDNAVGDFEGQLSNSGERVSLLDAAGRLIDSARYTESDPWPYVADGLGHSLERVVVGAPGDDPAAWSSSTMVPDRLYELEGIGNLGNLLGQRLILGVNGVGEFIVDDVLLEDVNDPGVNIIANGDFEEGLAPWVAGGNSALSSVEDGIGVGGSKALRLRSEGGCVSDDCASSESVAIRFALDNRDKFATYRLRMKVRYVGGSTAFYGELLKGAEVAISDTTSLLDPVAVSLRSALLTPGMPNSRGGDKLPPHVTHRGRFPLEPTSSDEVTISARVSSGDSVDPLEVELTYQVLGADPATVAMADDGQHGDGDAEDGIYAAVLPALPHDTQVRYYIEVRADSGSSASPIRREFSAVAPEEWWGYYVNDEQPDSVLDVYHVLVPGVDPTDPAHINNFGGLNCVKLSPAAFAYRGELYPRIGIRFRGNTACWVLKRNLKLRFPTGRTFQGLRKVNLQGLWTDKSLVREHLAWSLIGELGAPYCETEFIRVHLNGAYHGLFLYLEHPDRRFLDRNGLDADGCLYKAKQPSTSPGDPPPVGVRRPVAPDEIVDLWEEETCEDNDFSDVTEFIEAMHDDARAANGPTAEFMESRTFEDMLIGYQVSQVVLNNIDSFGKNHFLYGDLRQVPPRWGLVTWDMDLVFGKFFTREAVGEGRPVGTLNDCMLSPEFDLNPWFAATVLENPLLNYFVDFFYRAGSGYYQRAYLIRLWDVLQEKYTNDAYDPRLDFFLGYLFSEQEEDIARWGRYPSNPGCEVPPDMAFHIRQIKDQLRLHRNFLLSYIRAWHPGIPDHDRMKITELMYDPEGSSEDLEFVEILNTTGREINASGWRLDGGVRFTFPEDTLIEAGAIVLVVKSVRAFAERYPEVIERVLVMGDYDGRLANEGEELRLLDAGPGYPATVDFLRYETEGDWPEVRNGRSIVLTDVTPYRDNDRPESWAGTAEDGGTPGSLGASIEKFFVRGDSDGDRELSTTDAVRTLLYLFAGGASPWCEDAADTDDDGEMTLADAVYGLAHLFTGGPPPSAPFPEAGSDPTDDPLECR